MNLRNFIRNYFMLSVVSSNEELPLSKNPSIAGENRKIFKACININNKHDRRLIYSTESMGNICQAISHDYLITLPKTLQSSIIQYLPETAKKQPDEIFITSHSLVDKISDPLIERTFMVLIILCAILYVKSNRRHNTVIDNYTINYTNIIKQIINLDDTHRKELFSEMVNHMLTDIVKPLLSSSDNVRKLTEAINSTPECIPELAEQINNCTRIKGGLARNSKLVDNLEQENFCLAN